MTFIEVIGWFWTNNSWALILRANVLGKPILNHWCACGRPLASGAASAGRRETYLRSSHHEAGIVAPGCHHDNSYLCNPIPGMQVRQVRLRRLRRATVPPKEYYLFPPEHIEYFEYLFFLFQSVSVYFFLLLKWCGKIKGSYGTGKGFGFTSLSSTFCDPYSAQHKPFFLSVFETGLARNGGLETFCAIFFVVLCVSDHSRCCSLWIFEIVRATLSFLGRVRSLSLWVCSFLDFLGNPSGILCMSNRSCCGAVLVETVKEIWHRETFTHSKLSHKETPTQKNVHRETFTDRTLLHKKTFTQINLDTDSTHSKPLHSFHTKQAFTQKNFYT